MADQSEDIGIQTLIALHRELMDLYEHQAETTQAIHTWANLLRNQATTGGTTPENRLFFGRGDPNDPGAMYQFERLYKDLIMDSEEGGRNIRLHRNGVIALTYSLWEVEYRDKIAKECGLTKNDIKSDTFHDLNKYRQAVLKVGGRLDRQPKVLRFFKKGEVVSFTKDHMDDLFSALMDALNEIGRIYYEQNPGFRLDKPMTRSGRKPDALSGP